MEILTNYQLKSFNTFGVEARAAYFCHIKSHTDIKELFSSDNWNRPRLIIGGGSNILFAKDFEGLLIKNDLKGIKVQDEDTNHVLLRTGAGENWHEFVIYCIGKDYGGIENLSLIPGCTGAAPIQNIGAYGVELKNTFYSLEVFDLATGDINTFNQSDCKFGYRDSIFRSIFKNRYLILSITLKLTKKYHRYYTDYGEIKETLKNNNVKKLTIKAISDAVIRIRTNKIPDPKELGNAGSFFKNPMVDKVDFEGLRAEFPHIPGYNSEANQVKIPAAWMIEHCGWKGKRRGQIGVHDKQALVIVNYGGGKGKDIAQLAFDIRDSVADTFGIELQQEVNIIS